MIDTARIAEEGRAARAAGRGQFDNPFYRPENLPAATGELASEWNAKVEAWDAGWRFENVVRSVQ